jgi:hypothetical protein
MVSYGIAETSRCERDHSSRELLSPFRPARPARQDRHQLSRLASTCDNEGQKLHKDTESRGGLTEKLRDSSTNLLSIYISLSPPRDPDPGFRLCIRSAVDLGLSKTIWSSSMAAFANELRAGDCPELGPPSDCVFKNESGPSCTYLGKPNRPRSWMRRVPVRAEMRQYRVAANARLPADSGCSCANRIGRLSAHSCRPANPAISSRHLLLGDAFYPRID